MSLESDSCRAAAESAAYRGGKVNGQSEEQGLAAFDRTYRDCMESKGYELPAAKK